MTNAINAFLANAGKDFYKCFLENRSYLLYLKGLRNTLLIAFGSCLLGLIIGIAVTCVRIIPKDKPIARFFDKVAGLYVTVIRGTPVVLQLFICYFVILKSMKSANFLGIPETRGIPVAIIAFGLNSGAYMAEILRGGINSVDLAADVYENRAAAGIEKRHSHDVQRIHYAGERNFRGGIRGHCGPDENSDVHHRADDAAVYAPLYYRGDIPDYRAGIAENTKKHRSEVEQK